MRGVVILFFGHVIAKRSVRALWQSPDAIGIYNYQAALLQDTFVIQVF